MSFTLETLWNCGIGIVGVVVFFSIVAKNAQLKKIKKKVESTSVSVIEEVDNASNNSIETEAVIKKSTNFKAIDNILKEYNELSAKLNSDIQMISLFPMAGLLGTVWGLMSAMRDSVNTLDINQLGLALSTTFTGLICAMFLKAVATKFSIKEMEIIENKIAEADRKYNQLISRGKFISKSNIEEEI